MNKADKKLKKKLNLTDKKKPALTITNSDFISLSFVLIYKFALDQINTKQAVKFSPIHHNVIQHIKARKLMEFLLHIEKRIEKFVYLLIGRHY